MLLAAKVLCTITYEINIREGVVNSKRADGIYYGTCMYMYVYYGILHNLV